MTEENKEKNLNIFIKKLEQIEVDTSILIEKYGEKLLNATFTNSNEFGNAYDGSLIEIVLKVLTPYAVRLNELLPEAQRVDKNTLVKICLLHQIAKAVRIVPNDNQWEIEKRGLLYKYNGDLPSIRTGLHSVSMCIECGIPLSTDEIEVMTINDRDLSDDQARWHASVMATIVRQANELTYIQINNKK
jgi:hypothetical protein